MQHEVAPIPVVLGPHGDRVLARRAPPRKRLDEQRVTPRTLHAAVLRVGHAPLRSGRVRRVEAAHVAALWVQDRHDLERVDVDVVRVTTVGRLDDPVLHGAQLQCARLIRLAEHLAIDREIEAFVPIVRVLRHDGIGHRLRRRFRHVGIGQRLVRRVARQLQPVVQVGHHIGPNGLGCIGVGQVQHLLLDVAGDVGDVHVHAIAHFHDPDQRLGRRLVVDGAGCRHRLVQHAVEAGLREDRHQVPAIAGLEGGLRGRLHVVHGQAIGGHAVVRERCTRAVVVDEALQRLATEVAHVADRHVVQDSLAEFQVDGIAHAAVDDPPALKPARDGTDKARQRHAVDRGEAATIPPAVRPIQGVVVVHGAHVAVITAQWCGRGTLALVLATIGRHALELAIGPHTAVRNLLQHQQPFLHAGARGGLEQRVQVTVGIATGIAVAADDERASHAAGDLQRGGAVEVAVIPERACRVVARHIDLVELRLARLDLQEDVVGVAPGADPQAVRVQVGDVEAPRVVLFLVLAVLIGIRLQVVGQLHVQPRARLDLDGGRHQRAAGITMIAAQPHTVVLVVVRVPDVGIHITDIKAHIALTSRWQRGLAHIALRLDAGTARRGVHVVLTLKHGWVAHDAEEGGVLRLGRQRGQPEQRSRQGRQRRQGRSRNDLSTGRCPMGCRMRHDGYSPPD